MEFKGKKKAKKTGKHRMPDGSMMNDAEMKPKKSKGKVAGMLGKHFSKGGY